MGEEAGEMGGAASLSHRLGKCSNFYLMRFSSVLTFACRAVFSPPLAHTHYPIVAARRTFIQIDDKFFVILSCHAYK